MGVGNAMLQISAVQWFSEEILNLNSQNSLILARASKGCWGWWSKHQLSCKQRAPRAVRGVAGVWHLQDMTCVFRVVVQPGVEVVREDAMLACLVSLMCSSCAAQAERIMEAIELYREEMAKLKEHNAICKAAGKEVKDLRSVKMPRCALGVSFQLKWEGLACR